MVYYKLRQVLQSAMDLLQIATGITKCDDYYKLRQYTPSQPSQLKRFFFYMRIKLTPLPEPRAGNRACARSDFLALIGLTRFDEPQCL